MAFKPVSFYGSSRGPLTPARRDYMTDPRRMMAEQLIQQGSSTAPVQSPLEGLARALQAGVGGYFGGQAKKEMADREAAQSESMMKILSGMSAKPWVNPDTGAATIPQELPPGVQGPPQMVPTEPAGGMAGALAAYDGNPDNQQMVMSLQMQQMAQEQAARQAEIDNQRAREDYKWRKGVDKEFAPAQKLMTVSPGSSLVDPVTGKPIYTAPEKASEKNRPTAKDEAGILRYIDTQEPVFDQSKIGEVPKDPKLAFEQEDKLRDEFTKGAGEFVKVRDAWNRIQASVKNPSAAGDLSLIFNYMKVLDPGSTVREGEFATAQNSAGVSDILRAKYNSVISGERLADAQRNDFASRAKMLYETQENQYKTHEGRYRGLAKMYGLDPEKVVYGMGAIDSSGTGAATPKILKFDAQGKLIQ